MASVNWLKAGGIGKKKTVKALLHHNSKETRMFTKNPDNEHINKQNTHKNITLDGLTYKERCKKYDDRLEELDSTTNKNKRKDRATAIFLEVPCPEGLFNPKDPRKHSSRLTEWFTDVHQLLCERYGADNCICSDIHLDEIHQYYDEDTGELVWSRPHLHWGFIAEVDGKLNAKFLEKKGNMIALNNAVEEMTQRDYGCKFMTGEKARKKSVEELKEGSAKKAIEMGANEILSQAYAQANEEVSEYKRKRKAQIDEELSKEEERKNTLVTENNSLQQQIQSQQAMIQQNEEYLADFEYWRKTVKDKEPVYKPTEVNRKIAAAEVAQKEREERKKELAEKGVFFTNSRFK